MNWSPVQEEALQAVDQWIKDGKQQVFRLFGYAGTGKTTLAKYFADNIGGRVSFGAFTGKAALVLRQKGCRDATTIHKLIYRPKDKSKAHLVELEEKLRALEQQQQVTEEGEIIEVPGVAELREQIAEEKKNINRPAFTLNLESDVQYSDVVIIDECSMVDEQIGGDLLSFGVPVLVLGDPAQLPPVKGCGFFTNQDPDVMLTEIHRQAEGNPIIRMATKVRQGETLPLGSYGGSRVITKQCPDYSQEFVLKADQVIVGRNATRNAFNRQFRRMLGRESEFPEPGDKLVCLRNNHDIGILNGEIWFCEECTPEEDFVVMKISGDSKDTVEIMAHAAIFKGEEIPWWAKTDAEEFDYGYALTCHKSQGSQWNNVVVFDESQCFRQNKFQWLYTAITRASDNVTIVV